MASQQEIDIKYKGVITLFDAINDPIIQRKLEPHYLPEIVEMEGIEGLYIANRAYNRDTLQGPQKIGYLYLDSKGICRTDSEMTYTQINKKCKGFLARFSLFMSINSNPEGMILDYFVDISNIKYRIHSIIDNDESFIMYRDVLEFQNITDEHINISTFDERMLVLVGIVKKTDPKSIKEEIFDLLFK
jgi:hypothetical protein